MWPFTKARTCSGCAKLSLRLDELQAAHDALRAQHLSLRGRVYALWGKEKPNDGGAPGVGSPAGGTPSAVPGQLSRAELRKLAGIRPGQPFPHRDTQPTSED